MRVDSGVSLQQIQILTSRLGRRLSQHLTLIPGPLEGFVVLYMFAFVGWRTFKAFQESVLAFLTAAFSHQPFFRLCV